MTWLYVGTFGSFIGFAAGLPLLIKNNFEAQGHQATTYAWIGPFVGALMRWAGGRSPTGSAEPGSPCCPSPAWPRRWPW